MKEAILERRPAKEEDLVTSGLSTCRVCGRWFEKDKHGKCLVQMEWQLRRTAGHTLTCQDIVAATARYFRVPVDDIRGKDRSKHIVRIRHLAMWICRTQLPELSYPDLGAAFAMDHTSIMAGVDRIEKAAHEPRTREAIVAIEALL